ncbi:MAG: hypothetical protein AABZ55_12785, partial [Bdellovibrionota bacterium]
MIKKFPIRALRFDEGDLITGLPYKFRSLNLGRANRHFKDELYVKNKQVLFGVDISGLPARANILKINQLALHLTLTKEKTGSLEQELFCFINQRVCSGQLETHQLHNKVSEEFFRDGTIANQYFSDQNLPALLIKNKYSKFDDQDEHKSYAKNEDLEDDSENEEREHRHYGNSRCHRHKHSKKLFRGDLDLRLDQLVENSRLNALDIIYGNLAANQALVSRSQMVVIADDVYVMPGGYLLLDVQANTCDTPAPS